MNRKTILILFFLPFILLPEEISAQYYLNIKPVNGSDIKYDLWNLRKIVFIGKNTAVYNRDGVLKQYANSGIDFLYFSNIATGIQDIEKQNKNSLHIYPNPALHVLNIKYDFAKDKKYSLTIFDLSGKLITNSHIINYYQNIYPLNVSGLNPGIYLLKITSGLENISKTFVKAE